MPDRPWHGEYIKLTVQGEVEWGRCVACGRQLTDPESRSRGFGPDCARSWDPELLEARKQAALASERNRWRADKRWEDYQRARARAREGADGPSGAGRPDA